MHTYGHTVSRGRTAVPGESAYILDQVLWFVGGLVLAFAMPFVFTSALDVQHDVYYLLYFAVVLTFLGAYLSATHFDVASLFTRNWRWSLALGALSTAFVVTNVLSRDSTDGPAGLYAAFEFGWRGLAYGIVDALLLTAFPVAVVLSGFGGRLGNMRRRALFFILALPLIMLITGVYHLGYEQFREDGIGPPEFGNTVISAPALLTTNPIGSVFAHATMHAAADVHSYETDIFLPPQTDAPD